MDVYVNTPVEAALWSIGVGIQDTIAKALTSSSVFVLVLGFSIAGSMLISLTRASFRSLSVQQAVGEMIIRVIIMSLGITFLTSQSLSEFSPKTPTTGRSWSSFRQTDNHIEQGKGMFWYMNIHGAFNNMGSWLADLMGTEAGSFQRSTDSTLRMVAQASRAMFDDPEILASFHDLDSNCLSGNSAKIVDINTGLMDFYDISPPCEILKENLHNKLSKWAKEKSSLFEKLRVQADSCRFFFLCSKKNLDKALIAFATRNYAEEQYDKTLGVHKELLFEDVAIEAIKKNPTAFPSRQYTQITAAGAMYVDRLLSANTLETVLFTPVLESGSFQRKYKNDFRNHAAKRYDQILTLLPAIRGWTQVALCILFLVASIAMCLGIVQYFIRWLGICAMMTMYQPVSVLMYYIARKFIDVTEVASANTWNAADPTMIGVAQYLINEISTVQAIYFGSQCILIASTCFIGARFFSKIEFKPYFTSQQFAKVQTVARTAASVVTKL